MIAKNFLRYSSAYAVARKRLGCLPEGTLRRCNAPTLPFLARSTAGFVSRAANRCDLGPDRPPDRSYFTECRPEPVSPEEKAAVLRTLPRDGAITAFTPAQRAKLDAVGRVLPVLGRDNVYEVRVIDVPQAWTGLYDRAVLMVSAPALDLLSATELQALVAHEAGHEYLFRKYEAARLAGDHARLREVETACDAVAVLLLNTSEYRQPGLRVRSRRSTDTTGPGSGLLSTKAVIRR